MLANWMISRGYATGHGDTIRKLLDELEMSNWQPIETAPRGQKVILFYRNRAGKARTVMGRFHKKGEVPDEFDDAEEPSPAGWYEDTGTHEDVYLTDCPPTHWMPLPDPPNTDERDGDQRIAASADASLGI
jgi:hypothetical protein